MRMRRKRNLSERLLACKDLILVQGRPMLNLKEAAENYRVEFDYSEIFGDHAPLEMEVGCGNGAFIFELSNRRPEKNYLAVEISSNVILTAAERCKAAGTKNVRFLNIPAEILPCYIKERSIETIYLNFSTPLPEKSREKQRLTSNRFLEIYKKLLVENGKIIQKTDSEPFFEYSLNRYEENGFRVTHVIRDLSKSEYAKDNIVTEYERGFLNQGLPIFCAVAVLPAQKSRE